MAFEAPILSWSFPAGASLTASQYLFMELSSSGTVTVSNAAGERSIGVLQNNPASGQPAEVMLLGITKVKAGATIAVGDYVKTNSSGKADVASLLVQATGAGSMAMGICLKGGGADELITILLLPQGALPTSVA